MHTCSALYLFSHYVSFSAERRTSPNSIFLFQMLTCQFSSRVLCPVSVYSLLKVINVCVSVNILDRVYFMHRILMSLTSEISLAWVDTLTSSGEVIQLLLQLQK